MENMVVPTSPARHPATIATTGGRGHKTPRALTAASETISHRNHAGPKALYFNKSAEDSAASTIIAASAQRTSQLDLRRHAHTAPIPTSAAIAGASATV